MRMKLWFIWYLSFTSLIAQQSSKISEVWVSDNGDGTYTNPILHADYSDPDVIRVGEDYYLTSSSFNCVPGLPILHSKDLVNWKLINYALPKLIPDEVFVKPQHGNGIWAPCIRYHQNEFYIYYPDPDFGIYMIKTKDPGGNWSDPVLVKEGKGLIDPSPLWDDDGKVYLTYAFAGSRAGIKSLLAICTLNAEGTKANSDDVKIFDGHTDEPTIEGPKIYKYEGFYYIFAPAGGVTNGWQTVLRSKNIYGPYEKRRVMQQGSSAINGPHQGAWIKTQTGEDWFIHFQDKGAFGRIVHLQPMKWINDWPVIGKDEDGDGIGEPVVKYSKPRVGKTYPILRPPESDEFDKPQLGLQWQWHANPQVNWGLPTSSGHFSVYCQPKPTGAVNLWEVPNLLLQKFTAEVFTATSKITFHARSDGDSMGFLVMGLDYSYIGLRKKGEAYYISQIICKNADRQGLESESEPIRVRANTLFLQVKVGADGVCDFLYSEDGEKFIGIGKSFRAREGKWIGAKIGFFALSDRKTNDSGSVDIDFLRINK
ncbi:MAG: glycoside hydrolase 43 family protein [Lutimonas sp.]